MWKKKRPCTNFLVQVNEAMKAAANQGEVRKQQLAKTQMLSYKEKRWCKNMKQYICLFFMSTKASWLSNTDKNCKQKRMGKIIKHLGDTRK